MKEDHPTKKSGYTAEEIASALKETESGTSVPDVCRKMGIKANRPSNGGRVNMSAWVWQK